MTILIDAPVDPGAVAALTASRGYRIDTISPPGERSRDLDPNRILDVDVLFCGIPPSNFSVMRGVKWIQLASTGYSQLFGIGLVDRNIRAANCRGCLDVPIAEWTITMMVSLARNSLQMFRNQQAAIWDRAAVFQKEIRGLTLGIWGYGGLGRETARVATSLGLRVHVLTRNGIRPRGDVYRVAGTGDPEGVLPHRQFRSGEERDFLGGLDFLLVATPLTHATKGMIGERELRSLPPHAFVLNPARAAIIQEEALLRALREGWIAGAALDAHYAYPLPPDHPLWSFPNVILTPHISGSGQSPHFVPRLWEIFTTNLDRYEQGRPLMNELTRSELLGK